MTPEEFDRRIEFLLEHQAQFDLRMGKLEDSLSRLEGTVSELGKSVGTLKESHSTLTAVVVRLAELMEEHEKSDEERFKALTESQKHTDERLNALITIVERHLTGGDGRKSKK